VSEDRARGDGHERCLPWSHFGHCDQETIRRPAAATRAFGYWSDDVESDLTALQTSGLDLEVKSYNPDGSGTLLWAYAKGQSGPRIELVSRAMEPFISYWWSTASAGITASST